MAQTPNIAQGAGIPSQWSETLTTADAALITGHEPAVLTVDEIVAASQTLSALHVVGFDASGRLVPAAYDATYASSGVRPIGIVVVAIASQSGSAYEGLPVYRAGCFNPDALVWPASFDTDAKKMNAFKGSPTPTNIVLRRPKQATV